MSDDDELQDAVYSVLNDGAPVLGDIRKRLSLAFGIDADAPSVRRSLDALVRLGAVHRRGGEEDAYAKWERA